MASKAWAQRLRVRVPTPAPGLRQRSVEDLQVILQPLLTAIHCYNPELQSQGSHTWIVEARAKHAPASRTPAVRCRHHVRYPSIGTRLKDAAISSRPNCHDLQSSAPCAKALDKASNCPVSSLSGSVPEGLPGSPLEP